MNTLDTIQNDSGSGLDFSAGPAYGSFIVRSMAEGDVIWVWDKDDGSGMFGIEVAVKNTVGGTVIFYGHLKELFPSVQVGYHVMPGSTIGRAGSTHHKSTSNFPIHLHVELRDGVNLNPDSKDETYRLGGLPLSWNGVQIGDYTIYQYKTSLAGDNAFNYDGVAVDKYIWKVTDSAEIKFLDYDSESKTTTSKTAYTSLPVNFKCDPKGTDNCETNNNFHKLYGVEFAGHGVLGGGGGSLSPKTIPNSEAASLISDLNIPDGSTVSPSQSLTKTWRIQNTGTTTWGSGYQLAFVRGDQMGAPAAIDIPSTAPGQTVDVSVPLTSPGQEGSYAGYWQMRNPQGTYFGSVIWVKLEVKNQSSNHITVLSVDPPSPSNTSSVHLVTRVENFANFRALRIKVDGQVKYELGATEVRWDWNTAGYQPGDHSISVEITTFSDPNWDRVEARSLVYHLVGTSGGPNHAPNRPTIDRPYDWQVYYSGNTANLCANAQGDPDSDPINGYYFEIFQSAQNWSSGWTSSSCVNTAALGPYTYQWHVKVRDSRGAESDWSNSSHFTLVNPNLTITDLHFEPQDSLSERVKIRACTAGQGGVGITMRVLLNDKVDGVSGPDQWHIIHELGVPCYNDTDAPIWTTLENVTGPHKVRVEAHGSSTGWNGAAAREEVFNVPNHRPDAPRNLAPLPASLNWREPIYVNSQDVTFQWKLALRADSYTLHVGTSSDPKSSSNPLFRQTYTSGTTQATVHLNSTASELYWQVTSTNSLGTNGSGDQLFGIDLTPPTCAINALPVNTTSTNFTVGWTGSDALSQLKMVDIQYRDGSRDSWHDWLVSVPASQTSGGFQGLSGHRYSFRCRATDNANNTSGYMSETGFMLVTQASNQSDLAVLSLNPYLLSTGQLIIEAVVKNQGIESTGNGFYTDLYVDHLPTGAGDYTGSISFWVNDPIPAGATATLTSVVSDLSQLGLRAVAAGQETSATLYVQADSAGALGESDKTNNISPATQVCFAAEDAYESDDTAATAVLYGDAQSHNFGKAGDTDWVKFSAKAGDPLRITTSGIGAGADTVITLYDTDGTTVLASNDDYITSSLDSEIDWEAPADGTYFIQVTQWNPNAFGCGMAYSLSIGSSRKSILLPMITASSQTTQVVPLSAGWFHTCALTNAGSVKCWGDNNFSQLGDGTKIDRYSPANVLGLQNSAIAVSSAEYHTCALTRMGGVKCWGANWDGMLGDGTNIDRLSPVDVVGLSSGVTVIGTGDRFSCALLGSGGVKCWGDNLSGNLGDGTYTTSFTPVDVAGLSSGVKSIAIGLQHACALTTTGGVKCWGLNKSGKLGDGTPTARNSPVDVAGLSSWVTAITAGYEHTCALMIDGGVKCWGYNGSGELGNGTTNTSWIPVDVIGLSDGIKAVSAGKFRTCALTITGGMKCWGDNYYGALGDGTKSNRSTPVDVVGLASGVTEISAGGTHSCARMIGGSIKCWGWNLYGQLGNGTNTESLVPVDVNLTE